MICKHAGCTSEALRRPRRGRPPSYCPTHGTNRAALERKRRAEGTKPRLKLGSPQAREARAVEREKRADRDAKRSLWALNKQGFDGHIVKSPGDIGMLGKERERPGPSVKHGQWLTETGTWDKAPIRVIGQRDLRADWLDDGYLINPEAYRSAIHADDWPEDWN